MTLASSLSLDCCRKCGSTGSYVHCWLTCLYLHYFWQSVLWDITSLIGETSTLTADYILLGWHLGDIPVSSTQHIISILLMATRSAIALWWKSMTPPTRATWHAKVWEHCVLSKLIFHLSHTTSAGAISNICKIWQPVLPYLSQYREIPRNLYTGYL